MLGVCIAACLLRRKRFELLIKSIESIRAVVGKDTPIVCGFDKRGPEGADDEAALGKHGITFFNHCKGLGYSFARGEAMLKDLGCSVVLQTEDDWLFEDGHAALVPRCVTWVQTHPDDIIRLTHPQQFLEDYPNTVHEPVVDSTGEFCLIEPPITPDPAQFSLYVYSNHPHIKAIGFHQKHGAFVIDGTPAEVEIDMCIRVIRACNAGACRVLVVPRHYPLAHHIGGACSVNIAQSHVTSWCAVIGPEVDGEPEKATEWLQWVARPCDALVLGPLKSAKVRHRDFMWDLIKAKAVHLQDCDGIQFSPPGWVAAPQHGENWYVRRDAGGPG